MTQGFRGLDQAPPDILQEHTRYLRRIREAVNLLFQGKLNNTLDFTLTAGSTTSVIQDPRLSGSTAIGWMAMTANAKTAEVAGIYVTAQDEGVATLNHANTADVDKTFRLTFNG